MLNESTHHAPSDGTDWTKVDALTEEQIERLAQAGTENPATTADDWAHGVVGLPPLKMPVNAKFDADVVSWFIPNPHECGSPALYGHPPENWLKTRGAAWCLLLPSYLDQRSLG